MTRMIGFSGVCASLFATLALSVVAQASPTPPASVPAAATSASRPVMAALRPEGEIKCPVKGNSGSFKTFKVAWSVSPVSAPVWTAKSRAKTSPMPPAGLCGRYGDDMIAVVQGSTRDNDALSQLCLEAERSLIATASTVWTQREGVHGTATGVTPTQGAVAVYCVPYSVALAQRNVQLGITTVSVDNDPDKDGVTGADDRCPTIPGVKDNQGCPDNDTDGDKIVDRLDKCPNEPGIAPVGCPAPKAETPKAAAEPAPAAVTAPVTAPKAAPVAEITPVKKPEAMKVYIGAMTKINGLQPGQFAPCIEVGAQWLRVGGVRRLTLGSDGNFCYASTGLPATRTHGISGGVSVYAEGVLAKWLGIAAFVGFDGSRSLTEFNYETIRSVVGGVQFNGYFGQYFMGQVKIAGADGLGAFPGFPIAPLRGQFYMSLMGGARF